MKQITIRLDEEIHKVAKIKAVTQGETFMQYVVSLIQKDLGMEEIRKSAISKAEEMRQKKIESLKDKLRSWKK